MKNYDVIVVGAGSAGLANSGVAHTIGLKTLLIEQDPNNFGGDCTNYGCVPSKALIHIAQQFHSAKKAGAFGLRSEGRADMEKVLAYIHEKQDEIRSGEDAEALRSHGQEVLIGRAKFVDRNSVEVNGVVYRARIILLCTGSSPRSIKVDGMSGIQVYNNENIFYDCKVLPQNLVVIGGGPIGVELAQSFQRLGANVFIINRGNRVLTKEPENVSKILTEQLEKEGIKIYNNSELVRFEGGRAYFKSAKDAELDCPCDATLVAVGRSVNVKNMELDKAGIEVDDRGRMVVDTFLRTTNKHVYAIGDAAGSYMFSHGAEKMVRQLWRNLLIPIFKKENTLDDLSWVTFTDPQVAHFGLPESDLDENGVDYYRQDQGMNEDDRAVIQEYTYGHLSLWMDNGRRLAKRRLLAGSMIAPQAGELIQELELAKHAKIQIGKLTSRVYPYPVATRINQKTLRGVLSQNYTDSMKKLARFAFRLFN